MKFCVGYPAQSFYASFEAEFLMGLNRFLDNSHSSIYVLLPDKQWQHIVIGATGWVRLGRHSTRAQRLASYYAAFENIEHFRRIKKFCSDCRDMINAPDLRVVN